MVLGMSILLPPVPPITKEGFNDPVWPKWLSQLHRVATTAITLTGDAKGAGLDVVNVTLTNSAQTRINLGLGSIATQSASNVTITGGIISSATVHGTVIADNAATGIVGEYQEISSVAVAIPQKTVTNLVTLALPPGDWEVSGVVQTSGVTSITAGVSLSSLTNGALGSYVSGPNTMLTFSVPVVRINISAATNIYLPVSAVYTGTTCTAYGYLRARRTR